jgi:hypothetical protein
MCEILSTYDLPHPTLDACANALTALAPRYCAPFWDGAAVGVDFLSCHFNWNEEVVWCNPPFKVEFLESIFQKFVNERIKGYVIAPAWYGQSYWDLARRYASLILHIPASVGLFIPTIFHKSGPGRQRWDTIFCVFNLNQGAPAGHAP